METTKNNAMMAQKQITVTYTVEEAIKIAEVFDLMLSNLACDVSEGEAEHQLLDDALVLNLFVGKLRQGVYNAVLGE